MLLEVCVDDPDGLLAAIGGGADRIELCAALGTGGLTPSPGLLALAAEQAVPSYAMVRPRAGDFIFSQADLDVMLRDIDAVRTAGLEGVVLGASRPDGSLNVKMLERLVAQANGLGRTLHRAFDLVADVDEAVEIAVALGFERILTSGGAPTAPDGIAVIRRAVDQAAGRISIMPGSGITSETVAPFLDIPGIGEVHSSCSASFERPAGRALALGFLSPVEKRTSAACVRDLKARLAR